MSGGGPTLVTLIEAAARRDPAAAAIVHGESRTTYAELVTAADALAGRLAARGVRPGDRVAVAVRRSRHFVVGALAVLKTGAAYVPVDPAYPADRRAFLARDCGADLTLVADAADADACELLVVTDEEVVGTASPPPPAAPAADPSAAAYVIYTSGSTGTPKGVVVSHADVVHLVTADPRVTVAAGEVVAHLAPTAFDASVFEIWAPLVHGATVAILHDGQVSPAELATAIRRHRPDWMFLTSGLFHLMVDAEPDALREVGVLIAGGDVVLPRPARTAAALVRRRLFAVYGPTEGTVYTSLHEVRADRDYDSIPLGVPLRGKTMQVVDADGAPLPVGATGEIWLGGAGLAQGYHDRPELTAERFVRDADGVRRYRTGDRGRVRPDGEIDFVGRVDRQVKVRGFRVELGEIEAVLQEHDDVRAAVVVVVGAAGTDDRRLVAYVSSTGAAAEVGARLRLWLATRLPAYLHPSNLVVLAELPLDPNGKVDRSGLPAAWTQRARRRDLGAFVEPRGRTQQLVAGAFQDALSMDRVGAEDNFFELGGDSLRGARLLHHLRVFDIEVTARQFFREPTVAAVSRLVRR